MKRYYFIFLMGFVLLNGSSHLSQEKISVEFMPPVVVKTFPQTGDTHVDPSIREIKATFSKEMLTKEMWSWVKYSDETFPKITGQIYFLGDKKTCVLPVKLEPNKTYVIWINSEKWNYFKDKNHHPAVPYLLVFKTRQ